MLLKLTTENCSHQFFEHSHAELVGCDEGGDGVVHVEAVRHGCGALGHQFGHIVLVRNFENSLGTETDSVLLQIAIKIYLTD